MRFLKEANWDKIVYDIGIDIPFTQALLKDAKESKDTERYSTLFELFMDSDYTVAYNRQDLIDKLTYIKDLGVKVTDILRRAPRGTYIDVTKSYNKYLLK
jgi:predicted nucleotidyltransferase component of viral defense system